eukprot:gene17934-biopygen9909
MWSTKLDLRGGCWSFPDKLEVLGDIGNFLHSHGMAQNRTEPYGIVRIHTETRGNARKRAETRGNVRKRAETCGNTRKHAGTCGNMWNRTEVWKHREVYGMVGMSTEV